MTHKNGQGSGNANGHINGKDGHDPPHTETTRPAIAFDVERYERYLEDQGLSEDQKRAMLEALWSIIVSFVDLGFGIHPAQSACGQNGEEDSQYSRGVRDAVYSNGSGTIIEGEAVVISAAGEGES
ncbi:MAG: hypothetical protein IPO55_01610 [Alphaproteobacteria bacterium]|nr:hypothetical protein [Alphaproteobacteria bacterium]